MSDKQPSQHHRGQLIAFGIALLRGVLAIVLGIILIFNPARSQALLMNTMGFFWLTSGLVLLRRPERKRVMGQRTAWVIGLVGILTGLLVVFRNMARQWVPEIAVVELLGVVILLTGVLHMLGEFRVGTVFKARYETYHFLLGLLEVVLGLVLILSPLEHGPITYWAATIWSLVFGGLVIGDALAQRFGKPKKTDAPTQPDSAKSVTEIHEG
jgi:uncharacterized membrane protein HdeD (DUF308 family)